MFTVLNNFAKEGFIYKRDSFPIDAKAVKLLREATGAKLMDCKNALVSVLSEREAFVAKGKAEWEAKTEDERNAEMAELQKQLAETPCDPNYVVMPVYPVPIQESDMFIEAVSWLKIKNLAAGAARQATGTEGRVFIEEIHSPLTGHPMIVATSLLCETDFGARSDTFIYALDWVSKRIAGYGTALMPNDPLLDQTLKELSGKLGESIKLFHAFMEEPKSSGFYLHHDYKQGAVVTLHGDKDQDFDRETARQVAMHCVFSKPKYMHRDQVPEEVVMAERLDITRKLSLDPKNSKKPAEILEKIAEGQINKFYASCVLLDQPFFKDGTMTVGQFIAKVGANKAEFDVLEIGA